MAPTNLFADTTSTDDAYCSLRDVPSANAAEARAFVESLWSEFEPYADRGFIAGLAQDFQGRFWEMSLTVALLRDSQARGYALSAPKSRSKGAPDIRLEHDGRVTWIEAVRATGGLPGAPGYVEMRRPDDKDEFAVQSIPDEPLTARYTQAIATKVERYNAYRERGVVEEDDAYIIAVSSGNMPYYFTVSELPRIVKAVFPIGHPQVIFDRETGQVVDRRHQYRPTIWKPNGSPIATDTFLDPAYAGISAVLHSCPDASGLIPIGADYQLILNPLARNPVDPDFLPIESYFAASQVENGWDLNRRPGRAMPAQ